MTDPAMKGLAAIVLAAGKASRYREADPQAATKVVALYQGEPMVRHVARAALSAGCQPVVVVTGCEAASVQQALAGLDVQCTHNVAYESGIASSIIAGIKALPGETHAVFILLGDMPLVGEDLLCALAEAFAANKDAAAVVPVYEGVRGNPVLLASALFGQAMLLQGDEGARRMLRDPALKVVEILADATAAMDIDTPEALQEARQRNP